MLQRKEKEASASLLQHDKVQPDELVISPGRPPLHHKICSFRPPPDMPTASADWLTPGFFLCTVDWASSKGEQESTPQPFSEDWADRTR